MIGEDGGTEGHQAIKVVRHTNQCVQSRLHEQDRGLHRYHEVCRTRTASDDTTLKMGRDVYLVRVEGKDKGYVHASIVQSAPRTTSTYNNVSVT